jgi:predicted outer membrane repeat protein
MRTRRIGACTALLVTAALAGMGLLAVDAQAAGLVGTGTAASCTEAALDAALAGGGTVTFSCGGPATITVTSPKLISHNTTINGGGKITLSGGGTTQIFRLAALTTLALTDVTVTNGFSSTNGGAISGSGTLNLTRAAITNSRTGSNSCGGAISMDSTGKLLLTDSTLQLNSGGFGGAVCTSGSLISARSHFIFNHVTGTGGAVYLFPTAVMDMNGGDLNGNSATLGGGIILVGNAKATLHSTGQPISISANQATDSGGAIYNDPTNVQGFLKISQASFTGNAVPPNVLLAGYGGAIADSGAGMILTDSTFSRSQGRFGGALFVGNGQPGLTASIQRVTFDGNVVSRLGGGLYVNTQGTVVTLTDATFTNNQAGAGGAVARFAATLSILNSSMTSNTATQGGGGLYNDSGPQPTIGGYTEIHDSTIAANQAPVGGGIFNNAEANLSNVTVLNNSVGVSSSGSGAINRLHNTVLQNPGGANCVITGSTPASAGGNFATDLSCHLSQSSTDREGVGLNALLGPLTNDGPKTTWYAMPQTGSPLINKAVPKCSLTDQRHATRPDLCDIGAVEYGSKP